MSRLTVFIVLLLGIWMASSLIRSGTTVRARVAVCADGNHHDPDDIGATAMSLALLSKAGAADDLVHYGYASHIGQNTTWQHEAMIESANDRIAEFGFNDSVFFDCQNELVGASQHLAMQINASTETDPLVIIQAGPWETMALAFDMADPAKHQMVVIVSHSNWNDAHRHFGHHRNAGTFYDQYDLGGPFAGVAPPSYVRILDQNDYAFYTEPSAAWNWMDLMSPELEWVHDRTDAATSAVGDMSDAGMVFYFLTGNQTPTMADIQDFFS